MAWPDGGSSRRIPGEPGVWILIGGELLAFSAFFLVFVHYRGQAADAFHSGQALLDHRLGLVNTIVLLTSSLFVALGVARVRSGRNGGALWLKLALLCGGLFVGLKLLEYSEKISAGLTPVSSDYFMYFFAITGIHLIHVLIGSGALCFAVAATRREASPVRTMIVECVGIFWHLVDLLWILIFALLYLAGGNGQV